MATKNSNHKVWGVFPIFQCAISPLLMNISLRNVHQSCQGTNGEFSNITLEPEDVETLVGRKMCHEEIPIGRVISELTYDVPFSRHVTSNNILFAFFSQSIKVIIDQSQISMSKVNKKGQGQMAKVKVTYFSAIVVICYPK